MEIRGKTSMHIMDILSYFADVMYLIDRAGDIVIMSMIFSAMIVGFVYALSLIAAKKTLSFLPFFS